MISSPSKYKPKIIETNDYFTSLSGELTDDEARITLAKYLRINLQFCIELLTGVRLQAFQVALLKGMLNRNFCLNVAGRGIGMSYIAAIYCIIKCIFEPGTKILLAGPTFRTSRFIFNYIEKLVSSKKGTLLAQAFKDDGEHKRRSNDYWQWNLDNGSSITAIPLNGEKIRGYRCNVLVIDEFLLMPEDLVKNVLIPFLVSPQDLAERGKIRELEDDLIKQGKMLESERKVFKSNSSLIALSSASYTFENLYRTFCEWTDNINSPDVLDSTYFVSQVSYDAVPPEFMDKSVIEMAAAGGKDDPNFKREYCAQFTDGSDGFFSIKKMNACTLQDGESPHITFHGDKNKKYILSIDPNASNSKAADNFAMTVSEIDEARNDIIMVHGYARSGCDLKDHYAYMHYLLTHFNIHLIVIDGADAHVIDSANESEIFKSANLKIDFFDIDTTAEGVEYTQSLIKAKREYNKTINKICIKQNFTIDFISKANAYLQAMIDSKHVYFASRINGVDKTIDKVLAAPIDCKKLNFETMRDAIDELDDIIVRTKNQCALIEYKTTSRGTPDFDLPPHLRRDRTNEDRARKDSYTSLLLNNWGKKIWMDMLNQKQEVVQRGFEPIIIW